MKWKSTSIGLLSLIGCLLYGATADGVSDRPGYLGFVYTIKRVPADGSSWLQVIHVVEGSPAEKAGLLNGDLVVGLDGEPLRFQDDLDVVLALGAMRPEKVGRIQILRGGSRRVIHIVPIPISDANYEAWKANVARLKDRRERTRSQKPNK